MKKAFVLDPGGSPRQADKYEAPRLMADKSPVEFDVMVKPAGSACNLNCTYCFYLSKATLAGRPGQRNMSDETLELLIRSYIRIRGQTMPTLKCIFCGGRAQLHGR